MEKLRIRIEELTNSGASTRDIVDGLLELDRDIRDLGKGFTKEDLKEAKKRSKLIYRAITKVDKETGKLLINNIDI